MNADVSSSEECIKLSGELLQKYGYVNEGYTQAVLEREKIFPTGLQGKSIAIAIPHTENTFVNKPTVGVIIPKNPIKFCAMGNLDLILDCEIIFPLVVKDSHMQVKMLKQMMKVIQDDNLLRMIKNAKNKEDIKDMLKILEEGERNESC